MIFKYIIYLNSDSKSNFNHNFKKFQLPCTYNLTRKEVSLHTDGKTAIIFVRKKNSLYSSAAVLCSGKIGLPLTK